MNSVVRDRRGDGIDPSAERLAHDQHVRPHVLPVAAEEPPGAAQTRLDLVGHEGHAVLGAELARPLEEAVRGNDHAALPLQGLDQEADRVLVDGRLERVGVAVRDRLKPGVNGPNPSLYCASDENPTIVVVRPWKLFSQTMISALPAGTPFTL